MKRLVFSLASCLCVMALAACSRIDIAGVPTIPVSKAPPAPTVLLGVAATGAALDGAKIEIIDANGNSVAISDTVTGTNGSYRVVLPTGTALPVIIRATPPGGTPLLSIVPKPTAGTTATSDIVANINPITNLVSGSVLGGASATDNGSLATALSGVDTTTIDQTGSTIVQKVLGNSVSYDTFANDPNFVASDGTSSGSPADAILDTIAQQAQSSGQTTAQTLSNYAAASQPPELLNQPSFQVGLVSNMVENGTDPTQLETQLDNIGALPPAPTDGSTDVFRTVISAVPKVLDDVKTGAAAVTSDPSLVKVAEQATVQLIKDTIATKQTRFNASGSDVANMLSSTSFQSTMTKVIDQNVTPIIQSVASDPNASNLVGTLQTVADSITQQASQVASSFDYGAGTPDVGNLVAGYVKQTVTGDQTITASTIDDIASGTTSLNNVVSSSGDVSTIQQDIVTYANDNPDLVSGDVSGAIQQLPVGVWDQVNWDQFNWG